MNKTHCTYGGDREEALITYLYSEGDQELRAAFDSHVAACEPCTQELAALRGVQAQLDKWAPPELAASRRPGSDRPMPWWRQIPAWAQVAAALLFLGVSASIANLEV